MEMCSVAADVKWSYIGILISCDGNELRFCEGESLDSSWLAGVLCPILVYFHHMEPGLVLVERLENHHLEIQLKTHVRNSLSNFGLMIQTGYKTDPARFIHYCNKTENIVIGFLLRFFY